MTDRGSSQNGKGGAPEANLEWARATQWISRTLAAVLIMVLPGILGAMLDKRLGTQFISLLGFALGLTAGTVGLLVLAKRFTPPAAGKPLPWEEKVESEGKEAEDSEGNE